MRAGRIGQYIIVSVAIGLSVLGQAWGATSDEKRLLAEAERIVSQYKTVMERPPTRVPSRDLVDGPLLGNGDLGAVISGNPEAQRFWIGKNNFWRLKDGYRQGGPRLFGGLEINIPALTGGTYLIEQQIYPAITTSRFTKDESTVTMRSWVAATEDFLFVELAVKGKPVEVDTRLWAARGRGSHEELGRKDGILWATKAFTNDVVIPTAAACAMTVIGGKVVNPELEPVGPAPIVVEQKGAKSKPLTLSVSQPGLKFTLQPGQKMTVAVAMKSSFDTKDPLSAAQELALGLNAEKAGKLLEQHSQWWREFWAHSLVEIGDPFLEKTYYLSNYELGSSLRDPEFPTGLFGLCITDDDPRWAGDYHVRIHALWAWILTYTPSHQFTHYVVSVACATVFCFPQCGPLRFHPIKLIAI